MIGDTFSDSILVVIPLRLLWKLDKGCPQRRRLLIVFSSSIITTITSFLHAYCILRTGGYLDIFSGFIEVRHTFLLLVHPPFVLTGDVPHIFRSAPPSSFATSLLSYLLSAAFSVAKHPDHTRTVLSTFPLICGATETVTRSDSDREQSLLRSKSKPWSTLNLMHTFRTKVRLTPKPYLSLQISFGYISRETRSLMITDWVIAMSTVSLFLQKGFPKCLCNVHVQSEIADPAIDEQLQREQS